MLSIFKVMGEIGCDEREMLDSFIAYLNELTQVRKSFGVFGVVGPHTEKQISDLLEIRSRWEHYYTGAK